MLYGVLAFVLVPRVFSLCRGFLRVLLLSTRTLVCLCICRCCVVVNCFLSVVRMECPNFFVDPYCRGQSQALRTGKVCSSSLRVRHLRVQELHVHQLRVRPDACLALNHASPPLTSARAGDAWSSFFFLRSTLPANRSAIDILSTSQGVSSC